MKETNLKLFSMRKTSPLGSVRFRFEGFTSANGHLAVNDVYVLFQAKLGRVQLSRVSVLPVHSAR